LKYRLSLSSDENIVTITKPVAERSDSGNFEIKIKNTEGEDALPLKLVVLDKPAPCEGPLEAIDTTKSTVTLQWKPPKDDGGADISGK
jgi:hypothetical protein